MLMNKYFKVRIEKNIVTSDSDDNYFDEHLIREDVYAAWAKVQRTCGWEVTYEGALQLQAENCDVYPVAFLIREVES